MKIGKTPSRKTPSNSCLREVTRSTDEKFDYLLPDEQGGEKPESRSRNEMSAMLKR
jgi:hypothetical protein